MIQYPILKKGATIGVTAPSSGVETQLHPVLKQACESMERKGYKVVCGETVWTQEKARSANPQKRANEFMEMMQNENIDIIIPPWGGERLIEMLEEIDFEKINKKWVLGYSDTSTLLLAITLKTGIATANGTNLVDLRGEYSDDTTAMWETVLSTETGASVTQYSSRKYQKTWQHENPTSCVFHLTEDTKWKAIPQDNVTITGRLLGGCIDVIRHLIGTPYGSVDDFRRKHINDEPLIWFLENCELTTTDLRRSLVQMKYAGWFDHCAGILFGRSAANHPVEDYTAEDVYRELANELEIPIVYDIDYGHMPPQNTWINGAFAEIKVHEGKGVIIQHFVP